MRLIAVLAVLFGTVLFSPSFGEPKFPPLAGRIVDEAGLLSAEDRAVIDADLSGLERQSSDQIVVYVAKSLQGYPIEDIGYRLGRAWGIGQQGTNNGVILIVAPAERAVRIEVGRGLEPLLTDFMTKLIVTNAILPPFRRGDFSKGIKAGVRDIRDTLLGDVEGVKQRAAARKAAPRHAPANEAGLAFIVLVAVIIFVLWLQSRQGPPSGPGLGSRRQGRGTFPVLIPGGGWGGGSGGGGGGESGWSGGGGDFGGGGASGDW